VADMLRIGWPPCFGITGRLAPDYAQNNSQIFSEHKLSILNRFAKDIEDIFILHLSYIFYLNDHYLMDSDYIDCLDCGITPEPNSQYWVAPFIQNIFDTVIKENRMDLAIEIKKKTAMALK